MRWQQSSVRLSPELSLVLTLAMAPALAGEMAYVTCQNGDALGVLDLAEGSQQQQWMVPGQPAGVAASKQAIFTVAAGDKTVRKHDVRTGDILHQKRLDGGPIGIVLDPRRERLFVSDWYNARIWVLDAANLALSAELQAGAAPAGLAISDDGRHLASADRDADQVSVFDAETLTLLHRVAVGTRPFGLRFAPDGRLFVGNVGSDDISVVDPDSGTLKATVAVGARPYGVAFAQARAFVTNQYADTLSVIDLGTLETVATLETGEYPEGVDSSSDGKHIAVANWFENSVTVFDATSLSVLHHIDTCDGPRAFGTFILGGQE